ncbi:hypothetical protein ROZALSC1DRAFT_30717, partial [Rozella allomycis CSF55]
MGELGAEENKPDLIKLTVKASDGSELAFKVKKTTAMRKIMDSFCDKTGKNSTSVRFMFELNNLVVLLI